MKCLYLGLAILATSIYCCTPAEAQIFSRYKARRTAVKDHQSSWAASRAEARASYYFSKSAGYQSAGGYGSYQIEHVPSYSTQGSQSAGKSVSPVQRKSEVTDQTNWCPRCREAGWRSGQTQVVRYGDPNTDLAESVVGSNPAPAVEYSPPNNQKSVDCLNPLCDCNHCDCEVCLCGLEPKGEERIRISGLRDL